MAASCSIAISVVTKDFAPYESIEPVLWPHDIQDSGRWHVHDEIARNSRKGTISWSFDNVPAFGPKGCVILVTGRRGNQYNQPCDVFVGDAHLAQDAAEHKNSNKWLTVDVCDRAPLPSGSAHHKQFSLSVFIVSVPEKRTKNTKPNTDSGFLVQNQREKNWSKDPDIKKRQALMQLQPMNTKMSTDMLRGFVNGINGATVKLTDWLYHVCQESPRQRTDPAYFLHLAVWYMRWRDIHFRNFYAHPWLYTDILQFIVGHSAWSYPYCADECLSESGTREFRGCESFNAMRWLHGALRAGDCEDLSTEIATCFYALCDIDTEGQHPVLVELVKLARNYSCLFADTVIRVSGNLQLHAYIKLVPQTQLTRLVAGEAPDVDECHPVLFLDSTHRSWTPHRDLNRNYIILLRRVFQCLRTGADCTCEKCNVCHWAKLADMFTWSTPLWLWQQLTGDMYQYDLRYYEPRTRRVFLPQRKVDVEAQLFGLPSSHMDGHDWERPTPSEEFRLLDISEDYTQQGPFTSEEKSVDPVKTMWPPIPGLQIDATQAPTSPQMTFEVNKNLRHCVPVFLREADFPRFFPKIPVNKDNVTLRTQKLAAWLNTYCRGLVKVSFVQRLYLHEPDIAHFVFYLSTPVEHQLKLARSDSTSTDDDEKI